MPELNVVTGGLSYIGKRITRQLVSDMPRVIGMCLVLLGFALVMLVGCGQYWHQDGKSQLETDKDYLNCQGFASVTTPTGMPDDRTRLAEVTDNCMREKGYRQKGLPVESGTTQEQRKPCPRGDIVPCR